MAANVFHRTGNYYVMVFVRRSDNEKIFLHNVLPVSVCRRLGQTMTVKGVIVKLSALYAKRPDLKICHIGIRYEDDRQPRFYKPTGRPL